MGKCVEVNLDGVLVESNPQPSLLESCSYVVMTPQEFSQSAQVPDTTLSSQFFAFGFFMVVASYLGGWAVGSVLKVVRQAR